MAPPVTDARPFPGSTLLELLRPAPGRLEFASRTALICALTALVAATYQTPDAALTAYVVFFLNKPDRTSSILQSVALLVLFTVIVGMTLLVTMAVIDVPLWRVAAMSAISFGFLFLASASKLRPIGGILALIVAYGLDVLGMVPAGEVATRGLLYVWLFVGIPVGVSIVVNLLWAPPPRRLAERALVERLRLAAAVLRAPDAELRQTFVEQLREGTTEVDEWLKLAAVERTSGARHVVALQQAARSATAMLHLVELVSRHGGRLLPAPWREQLAVTLEAMAAILDAGQYPIEISLDDPHGTAALDAVAAGFWDDAREVLRHFAEPSDAAPEHETREEPAAGFLAGDAFGNLDHTRYALKTTAAAMFCYVLYTLLDWPSIHTCFITCYIVALGTTAETVEKLTLRIAGCLVGAACGIAAIVWVMPSVTSTGGLLGVVFVGTFAAAWIAAGSPRIAYAGFQVAFAFLLCVLQGPAPAFDMVVARDRVIGILIGNLVVYLFFTRIWPVSVSKRVDPAIARLLRRLGDMLRADGAEVRRSEAARAQAALGAIESDLDLIRYEPSVVRPPAGWVDARRAITGAIGALAAPLLLMAEKDRRGATQAVQDLERIAERLGSSEGSQFSDAAERRAVARATTPGTQSATASLRLLRRMVGHELRRLDARVVHESPNEGVASHAKA
jgi:multidrug resistance protein MdtO